MWLKLAICMFVTEIVRGQLTPTETYSHSATLESGNIKLYWKFTENDITFEVQGSTLGWIGIGWSPNGAMTDSDIIVGWVKNGQVSITDRHGASTNAYPPLDDEQNIDIVGGNETDGWTMFKFTRPLAACERDYDREITGDTLRLIYAWGDADPTGNDIEIADYHQSNKGVESIYFLESPDKPTDKLPEGPTYLTFDALNGNFEIPARDTYYNCRLFELPDLGEKHHIVKFEPIVQEGHESTVHHMLLYQCGHNLTNSSELEVSERCYNPNMEHFQTCTVVIAAWAIGGDALLYPEDAGMSIGLEGDPKYIQLETHYDNPPKTAGMVDNSGLRITYTKTLRKYDVGVIEVGNIVNPFEHFLPPGAESFLNVAYCPVYCLENRMQASGIGNITVFSVLLHSHLAGKELKLRHFRNGAELPYLASDASYDFNYQEYRHVIPHVTVQSGDLMQMECIYNTEGRTGMTEGGLSTSEEMCMSFVSYYPRIDIGLCVSSVDTDQSWPYFGISGINLTTIAGRGLNFVTVTAPPELNGKTVLEVMNEFGWNESKVDKFSEDLIAMNQKGYCISSEHRSSEKFPSPEITSEYQPPVRTCVDATSTPASPTTTTPASPTSTPASPTSTPASPTTTTPASPTSTPASPTSTPASPTTTSDAMKTAPSIAGICSVAIFYLLKFFR